MASDKKLSSRTGAWVGVLTLIVLLAALAVISQAFLHGRLDLTRDRQFTLSRATLKTLDALPDIVTVRVVMSRNLPAQFQKVRTQAVDLLREFEARSRGRLNLVFEDPGEDPAKRQAATSLGIQEVQLQEQSRDGMQVKRGFFGVALLYGDAKEVFPVVQNLETFEYDLVVRLKKLTGGVRTIGVVEGSDENRFAFALPGGGGSQPPAPGFDANFPTLKAHIERLYRLEKQSLAAPVDAGIDLLLVAAPARLSEEEQFRVDQYVLSGRPVIFLAPGMDVNLAMGISARPATHGYEELLAHYGIGVRKNVVLEPRQWEMVRFGNSLFPTPYPYWIVVNYNAMNPGNPVTADLQTLSFPWTSSLEPDSTAQPGAKTETLVQTTGQAWEETGNLFMYPREMNEYRPVNPRTFPLAALQTGILTSRFAAAVPAGIPPEEAAAALKSSRGDSRVLVISNALFASDFYLGYTNASGNLHFVLNALDYLALDPDLIRVRSRQIQDAPLDEALRSRAKTPVLLVNMLLVPFLLAATGVFAGIRRRKKEGAA